MRPTTFKEFLTEQPHFVSSEDEISCPYVHHEGDRILRGGHDSKDMFDLSVECLPANTEKEKEYKKKVLYYLSQVYYRGFNRVVVPAICIHDKKMFMWNPKTGDTYAPRNRKHISLCQKLIKAIQSDCAKGRNNNDHWNVDELTILEKTDEV